MSAHRLLHPLFNMKIPFLGLASGLSLESKILARIPGLSAADFSTGLFMSSGCFSGALSSVGHVSGRGNHPHEACLDAYSGRFLLLGLSAPIQRAHWQVSALSFGATFAILAWSFTTLPVAAKYRMTSV
ncbi:MAG: hypothetical protein KGP14_10610, partial [Betaproteobacteria bacterium]|nr:hypothetical protein [Betaproteobacteria bacterium]